MKKCKNSKKYKGLRDPVCNRGVGCNACWLIRYNYWDDAVKVASQQQDSATQARSLAWAAWWKGYCASMK